MDPLLILRSAELRFLAKVSPPDPESGCADWLGKTDRAGYGVVCILPLGKYLKAHRVAWMLANGRQIPAGLVVMHSCDRPICVSPDHLSVGTQRENMRGCAERGRARGAQGQCNHRAKIQPEQVDEIRRRRAAGETCAALGREFGVGRDQISRITNPKASRPNWRH